MRVKLQGIVIAGLSDLQKPAENLSLSQNLCMFYNNFLKKKLSYIKKKKETLIEKKKLQE